MPAPAPARSHSPRAFAAPYTVLPGGQSINTSSSSSRAMDSAATPALSEGPSQLGDLSAMPFHSTADSPGGPPPGQQFVQQNHLHQDNTTHNQHNNYQHAAYEQNIDVNMENHVDVNVLRQHVEVHNTSLDPVVVAHAVRAVEAARHEVQATQAAAASTVSTLQRARLSDNEHARIAMAHMNDEGTKMISSRDKEVTLLRAQLLGQARMK